MKTNFSFNKRNIGHWDVWADKERIFRIRGGGPESWDDEEIMIIGEHSCRDATPNSTWLKFKTITAATAWITDYLMHESKIWPEQDA